MEKIPEVKDRMDDVNVDNLFEDTESEDENSEIYETSLEQANLKMKSYRKEIRNLKQKITRLEKKNAEIKNRDILAEIFNEDQIEALIRGNKPDSTRGLCWSDATVEAALQLKFLCHENGYNLLLKNKIPLPALRTLRDRLSHLKLNYGVLDEMIQFLKVKTAAFSDVHKLCSLSIDEMSIVEGIRYDSSLDTMLGKITFPDQHQGSKTASKALVFMLAGTAGRWKQVVGYHFTGNNVDPQVLKEVIFEIIQKVHDIGLHVINLTTDQAGGNQALWKLLGCGKQKGM